MTDSMAETLSTLGLVAGFPLLLLCFMLSLEKLESWGLGDGTPTPQTPPDAVDRAVEAVEQRNAAAPTPPPQPAPEPVRHDPAPWPERPVAAQRGAGWPEGGPR